MHIFKTSHSRFLLKKKKKIQLCPTLRSHRQKPTKKKKKEKKIYLAVWGLSCISAVDLVASRHVGPKLPDQ